MFPVPFNEALRLEVLESYDILDSMTEESFDSLTRLAKRHFNVPVVLISLVDSDRQWFKSVQGLKLKETSRDLAFCNYAILGDDLLIVPDATLDKRFSSNDLVCNTPGIRFYAGAPLVTRHGFRLGTFCVIDDKPRQGFTSAEAEALQDFALAAVQFLEIRQQVKSSNGVDQELKLIEEARNDLFATVAHEIRSPLATLLSLTRVMKSNVLDSSGPQRRDEYLGLVSEFAEQIMNTADRMLEFAKLKTGEVNLKEEEFSVFEILDRLRMMVQLEYQYQPRSIFTQVSPRNVLLYADRAFVTQILSNLIGNAIKYSQNDSDIELIAEVSDGGSLKVTVSDKGDGMDSEEIARALEPYARIDRDGRDDPGGAGIGLPIVKRLIELQGGRLLIDSVEGVGTKTSIIFPAFRVTNPALEIGL